MQLCTKCRTLRPLSDFCIKNKRTGRRHSICKPCQRDYTRRHYRSHKADYLRKASRNRDVYRSKARAFVIEYLSTHPCVDCGEADLVVLDFDHRDRSKKTLNISKAIHCGTSVKVVAAEIDKCDVRCANCHRRRTAKQLNWFVKQALSAGTAAVF